MAVSTTITLSDAEAARVRAVRLVCEDGVSTADPATAMEASWRSVQHWVQRSARGVKPGRLRTRKPPGARPKLTPKQRATFVRMLAREFRVTFHVAYLPAYFHALGFTPQQH